MHRPPFVFVVGAGRSGTTLLRSMLDSHPEVAIPGESHFVATMARLRWRYDRPGHFALDRFLADVAGHERFQRWDAHEAVLASVRRTAPHDLADATRATYAAYAREQGARRYMDKTPDYVARMDLIAGLLPEARFVHLIRDGRAVAASLLAQPWGPDDPVVAARHWVSRVRKGRNSARRLGPDRVMEVRYEALVDDPETALRDICAFAELDFDPTVLDHRGGATRALEQVAAPASHGSLLAPLDPVIGMATWIDLDESTQRSILVAAAPMLRTLGYCDIDVGAAESAAVVIRHGVSVAAKLPRRAQALRRFVQ